MNVLITAGATRNPIDAVRYISAQSTGRTGVQLAERLERQGAQVFLLGSAEACLRAPKISSAEYGSTRDLMRQMRDWVVAHPTGAVIHASAVGDYEVADASQGKIESGKHTWTLELSPTPKIADRVRDWGLKGTYVTFKAAAPGTSANALERIAAAQRLRTGSDWVFANVLGRLESKIALIGREIHWIETRDEAIQTLARWVVEA